MTTALLTRPRPRPEGAGSALGGAERSSALFGPYLGYIGYFVGAGLISGSVVHYPLDPARYALIGAAGVLIFLFATVLNEFILPGQRPAGGQLLRIVGGSLLLSMGIGMLSGGIQHFNEFPTRSAVLVPAGLVVSFVAYIVRNAPQRWKVVFGPIGLGVLTTAVLAFAALSFLATHSAPLDHGHGGATTPGGGHAEQGADTDHHTDGPAGTTPAPVDTSGGERPSTTPAAMPTTPTATPTTTGASHYGHPHGAEEHHD